MIMTRLNTSSDRLSLEPHGRHHYRCRHVRYGIANNTWKAAGTRTNNSRLGCFDAFDISFSSSCKSYGKAAGAFGKKGYGKREVVEEHQWNASKSPWAEAEGLLEEWRLLKVMRRSERSEIICRRSCLVTMSG